MSRKTIKIVDLINIVNARNVNSTCGSSERRGWNSLLERILHDADVYAGFGYLNQSDVPEGHSPGIRETSGHRFDKTDDTRVRYYISTRLTQNGGE